MRSAFAPAAARVRSESVRRGRRESSPGRTSFFLHGRERPRPTSQSRRSGGLGKTSQVFFKEWCAREPQLYRCPAVPRRHRGHMYITRSRSLGTAVSVRRPSSRAHRRARAACSTSHAHIRFVMSSHATRPTRPPHGTRAQRKQRGRIASLREAQAAADLLGLTTHPKIREVYKQRSSRRSPRLSASEGVRTGGIEGGGSGSLRCCSGSSSS